MRVIALEYHDVVDGDDFDSAGFPGDAANSYKLSAPNFGLHLDAVAGQRGTVLSNVRELPSHNGELPALFTFDDGGSGALPAARLLESRGWRGHFFVTTARIGTPGFLSHDDIRALHAKGHVIGSHSHSHPIRMARLSPTEVGTEWRTSVEILQDLLKAPVVVASVPGGYYQSFVAEQASLAGIRWLFTSEPLSRVHQTRECRVIGRYTLRRQSSAREVRALVSRASTARSAQWVRWNTKKIVKLVAGDAYLRVRSAVYRERGISATKDGQ